MYFLASEGTGITPTPDAPWYAIVAFAAVFIGWNAFDMWINRGDAEVPPRRAVIMTVSNMALAVCFGLFLLFFTNMGGTGVSQWYTAYFVEYALSIDNLFVLSAIIVANAIPREYTYRVVFWGVAIAMIMRAALITVGISVVSLFEPVMILFGLWLLWTAYNTAEEEFGFGKEEEEKEERPEDRLSYRLFSKLAPVTHEIDGHNFVTRIDGKRVFTRLATTLVTIGFVDLLFAFDSIPVVLSITDHPFTAISTNLFAVMGLRTIYFFLSFLREKVSRLGQGMVLLLVFIGVKLILGELDLVGLEPWHPSVGISLGIIGAIVALSVIASLVFPKKDAKQERIEAAGDPSAVMSRIYLDADPTEREEYQLGLIDHYGHELLRVCGEYDTGEGVLMHSYGQQVNTLPVATDYDSYVFGTPEFETSRLDEVLKHIREDAKRVTGSVLAAIVTNGDMDPERERLARQVFVDMPDNVFVLFVRVSDAPGGAHFLQSLDDYNVGSADRCDTIHATDDAGSPLESIAEMIHREFDPWITRRRAALASV